LVVESLSVEMKTAQDAETIQDDETIRCGEMEHGGEATGEDEWHKTR
jgi:hypothetical protein